MPAIYGRDWDTALDGFEDAALCVLPGVPDPPEPFLFSVEALHAVLIAAVLHPEWAAAWYRDLATEERSWGDFECEGLAVDLIRAAPESDLSCSASLSEGGRSDLCEVFRVAAERVLPTDGGRCEPGAYFSKALHAVLIAAVRNPQWAGAWFEAVFATGGPHSETHQWAAEFVEVSRISRHDG